ncbi:hypothetical protein SASPL_156707 [Salvia splendens]|uniref:Uncharacterized protein n=1 Tax=Salvia splendens TaxID=180675 RepID=A0A8X8VWD9_SALSN|nr:hypothetical protein SASPL_156707 [Salvia splendens]
MPNRKKVAVPMDVKTRWNSTYKMLDIALKYRIVFERMAEECVPFIKYFRENDEKGRAMMLPSAEDWDNAKAFVQHLCDLFKDDLVSLWAEYKGVNDTVLNQTPLLECEDVGDSSNKGDLHLFDELYDGVQEEIEQDQLNRISNEVDKYLADEMEKRSLPVGSAMLLPVSVLWISDIFFEVEWILNVMNYYLLPLDVSLIQKDVSNTTIDAMKRTISGMLGLLPSEQFQVMIDALWESLSKLLISSMMTGYTLRNAEYRLSLERNLEIYEGNTYNLKNEDLQLEAEEALNEEGKCGKNTQERLSPSDAFEEWTCNIPGFGEMTPEARRYILTMHSRLSSVKKLIVAVILETLTAGLLGLTGEYSGAFAPKFTPVVLHCHSVPPQSASHETLVSRTALISSNTAILPPVPVLLPCHNMLHHCALQKKP